MLKKIILIFVLMVNFVTFSSEIKEENTKELKSPECRAYLVGDINGNIYYSENENEMVPLASVTKVMTLLLTYDAIHEGKIKYDDKVVVDKIMATMGGSRIWMKEGSKISVEDLIKATALHSANNAAYGLAKLVGGDIDKFVEMMNDKAEMLGFGDEIKYYTPTGLPTSMTGRKTDVGSALGVYKLSMAALKYEDYIDIFSRKKDVIYSGREKIYNRNKLIGKDGIYGIKTGHHDNWYNISVASDKDNINSIVVVLGAYDEKTRDENILGKIALFHSEYSFKNVLNKEFPVGELDIINGTAKRAEIYPDRDYSGIIKNDSEIKFLVRRDKKEAPFVENEVIGTYKLYVDDEIKDEGNVLIRENIEESEKFFKVLDF